MYLAFGLQVRVSASQAPSFLDGGRYTLPQKRMISKDRSASFHQDADWFLMRPFRCQ